VLIIETMTINGSTRFAIAQSVNSNTTNVVSRNLDTFHFTGAIDIMTSDLLLGTRSF
jgi:hypothetical protein